MFFLIGQLLWWVLRGAVHILGSLPWGMGEGHPPPGFSTNPGITQDILQEALGESKFVDS